MLWFQLSIQRTCLEVEFSLFGWRVKFKIAESDPITVNGLLFHFVIIPRYHPYPCHIYKICCPPKKFLYA